MAGISDKGLTDMHAHHVVVTIEFEKLNVFHGHAVSKQMLCGTVLSASILHRLWVTSNKEYS